MMLNFSKKEKIRKLIFVIISTLIVIETLFPIVFAFLASIRPDSELYQGTLIPKSLTLENYMALFRPGSYQQTESRGFSKYILNSAIVALSVSVISMILSSLAAYSVVRIKFKGSGCFLFLLLFSYLFPAIILIAPIYIVLSALNLTDTYQGIILSHSALTIPFSTWLLVGYFKGIPLELDEAAMLDGCSRLGALIRIIMPISLPMVASVGVFSFTLSWDDLIFPLILFSKDSLYTLPLVSFNIIYGEYLKWGQLMAAAIVSSLPPLILYMYAQKYLIGGLTMGAIKR
jgi:multiple sugar transport system permease protein